MGGRSLVHQQSWRILALGVLGATYGLLSLAANDAHAICAASLTWKGQLYYGIHTQKPINATGALRTKALEPPCRDTVPYYGPTEPTPTRVRSVVGLRPSVALASPEAPGGERRTIYLAVGYLPQLRGHPARRFLSLNGIPEGFTCSSRTRGLIGRIGAPPSVVMFLQLRLRPLPQRPERTVLLQVGEQTIVDVPRRNGLPYLSKGQRVTISYSVCRNGEARLLLTRAIRQVR